METLTIAQAAQNYLETVKLNRSANTARTYANALSAFFRVLKEYWIEPETSPTDKLKEDAITWLASYLKVFSPATERLYVQAIAGFYEFLAADKLAEVNLPRLRQLIKQRTRRPGQRLPQFPREDIEKVLLFVNNITIQLSDTPASTAQSSVQRENEQLRAMRDRAFLFTLADTGLRVHEACGLRRGDIDWNEGRALIIGKGDKQAVVRFSSRAMHALKEYLVLRAALDGASGRPLPSLPLFARHDKGAGKKVKPITTTTGRNIVAERVRQALGNYASPSISPGLAIHITPHSFRHYFVTTVLRASGNLKLAQELARHASIQVTQRYAHLSDDELDKGYHEIFESNVIARNPERSEG
jgi:integrase